jgi:lysophospholipase L1-like esterase
MQRYYVDYNPWVEYKAVDIAGGAGSFASIRLYYSDANDSSKVFVSYDSGVKQSHGLSSRQGVQQLDLSPHSPVKSIRLEFPRHDPIQVYGVSFDADKGVYVDNYPIRGYSGMYFSRIHESVLSDFQQHLQYDLVILQYGENVSNPANKHYTNYKNAMKRTVEHIQQAMPKVPVLIISAHDRSIKDASGYKTSPDIPILVKTQAELAHETDSAFFNLYEAMGGYNSMIGLVSQKPPLASSDYTHFNRRGADFVAGLLMSFLGAED